MTKGWKNFEPSPIEYFHGEIMNEYHNWRRTLPDKGVIEISGTHLNNLIANAKMRTYKKYEKLELYKPVDKSKMED